MLRLQVRALFISSMLTGLNTAARRSRALAAGSTITGEGCTPPNGAIDPGENVILDFNLMNGGGAATTNLVATLMTGGGVTNPSPPQNYGVIDANGGMAARSFSFTADPALQCGGAITATLQLNDNGNPLPNVTFNFTTGALVAAFSENFDGVVVPALPAGWTADQGINTAGAPLWVTSNAGLPAPPADTAPNATFSQDPANVCDNRIYTPVVMYSAGSQLIFRQNYNLEQLDGITAYDAGVLEVSINGGAYTDILAAGGTFAMGGYNHTHINPSFANPLLADHCPGGTCGNWSGISSGGAGGFEMCVVNLPAAGVGQPLKFRWRMGSDNGVSRTGWRVDTVSIAHHVCCTNAPTVTGAVSRKTHGAAGNFDIDLPLTGTTGVEDRSGDATNDFTVVVTFDSNVTVSGSPQAELTMGTGCVGSGGVCSGNVVVSGNTVTVPLTNIANAQTINVRLNGVTGTGDVPAVDVTIPMSILIGDTNGNRTVNAADVAQTKSRLGQTVAATNFRSDVNANGSLNAADVGIVKQNSGTSLPP